MEMNIDDVEMMEVLSDVEMMDVDETDCQQWDLMDVDEENEVFGARAVVAGGEEVAVVECSEPMCIDSWSNVLKGEKKGGDGGRPQNRHRAKGGQRPQGRGDDRVVVDRRDVDRKEGGDDRRPQNRHRAKGGQRPQGRRGDRVDGDRMNVDRKEGGDDRRPYNRDRANRGRGQQARREGGDDVRPQNRHRAKEGRRPQGRGGDRMVVDRR